MWNFLLLFLGVLIQSKVLNVQFVTRHCERNPIRRTEIPYNSLSEYPFKKGELTKNGLFQCESMGESIRKRYIEQSSEFNVYNLSSDIKSKDYRLYSSRSERCVESCLRATSAYFPFHGGDEDSNKNKKGEILNKISYLGSENDEYIRGYRNCPKIKERCSAFDTDWINSFDNERFNSNLPKSKGSTEMNPLKRFWSDVMYKKFGFNETNFPISKKNLNSIHFFYHFLLSTSSPNLIHNQTILLSEEEEKLFNFFLSDASVQFSTLCFNSYGSNLLLEHMFHHFSSSSSSPSSPLFVHYSGHESTLESIYSALDLYRFNNLILKHPPSFGSGVFFELHQKEEKDNEKQQQQQQQDDDDDSLVIRVVFHEYWNSEDFVSLVLNENNETEIPFRQFKEKIKHLKEIWKEECI